MLTLKIGLSLLVFEKMTFKYCQEPSKVSFDNFFTITAVYIEQNVPYKIIYKYVYI